MKKYLITEQKSYDERLFVLKDIKTGERYNVDFYTSGEIEHPAGVDETKESWKAWLNTFVGKTIEIKRITPFTYFANGIKIEN